MWLGEPADWDSYSARPISIHAVRRTHEVLDVVAQLPGIAEPPHITGTSDGGICCEWVSETVEIQLEIGPSSGSLFVWNKKEQTELETPLNSASGETLASALWQLAQDSLAERE
jgi:hypothetical protein